MKKITAITATVGIALLAACNTTGQKEKEMALKAQQQTIDSMKMELVKERVIDSMNEMAALTADVRHFNETPVVVNRVVRSKPKRAARSNNVSSNNDNTPVYTNNTVNQPEVQAQPTVYNETPAPTQKKGWSAKAKGAVIGGGAGAIAGAVIHKRQRAVGAVVGGILGAGAGVGIGAVIDKKNGRLR